QNCRVRHRPQRLPRGLRKASGVEDRGANARSGLCLGTSVGTPAFDAGAQAPGKRGHVICLECSRPYPGRQAAPMAAARALHYEKTLPLLTGTVLSAALIAFLYWAQAVLIPVALALFFAFLLNPVVMTLHRWGLRRVPAVLLVTLVTAL